MRNGVLKIGGGFRLESASVFEREVESASHVKRMMRRKVVMQGFQDSLVMMSQMVRIRILKRRLKMVRKMMMRKRTSRLDHDILGGGGGGFGDDGRTSETEI